jgi:hypothetical protein
LRGISSRNKDGLAPPFPSRPLFRTADSEKMSQVRTYSDDGRSVMGVRSRNSRPLDNTLFITAVTLDEAVAMLVGRVDGPVRLLEPDRELTAEEQDVFASWTYSLLEDLEEERASLESAYREAKLDGLPSEGISERLHARDSFDAVIASARMYRCAIDDEIGKGDSSRLQIDSKLSNASITLLTLSSLDGWAQEKYGMSLLTRDASSDSASERRELRRVAVTVDKGGKQSRGPGTKLRQQEEVILAELRGLGLDPKALPKNRTGKCGVKATVCEALSKHALFEGVTVFDHAWDRLRKNKDIVDAIVSSP